MVLRIISFKINTDMDNKNRLCRQKIALSMFAIVLLLVATQFAPANLCAQMRNKRPDPGPSTLGIKKGTITCQTPLFQLSLLKSSQTVSALKTNDADSFDFTPGDRLKARDKNGFYHLGDITLGIRTGDSSEWNYYSTSKNRMDIDAIPSDNPNVIAAADLSKTLPVEIPLQIIRYW